MEITNPAHQRSTRPLHNTKKKTSDENAKMSAKFPRTSISSLHRQQHNGESSQHGNPPMNRVFPRFHFFDHHLQDSRSTMSGEGAPSSGRRSAASGGSGWTVASSSANGSVEDNGQSSANRINMNCFLCKSLFKEPMILSCGHSFCRGCVERWLRKCTFCPMCRVPTLTPFRNVMLAEMVNEYKRIERGQASLFQRSVAQPLMRTFRRKRRVGATNNKEAKCIQRETIRASLRCPKEPKFSGDYPSDVHQTEKSVRTIKRPRRFAAANIARNERNKDASFVSADSRLCRSMSNSGFGGDFCATPWQRNVPTTTTRGVTSSASSLQQCQRAMAACRLNDDEEMPEDPKPNEESTEDAVEPNVLDAKALAIDDLAAGGFRRMTGLRKSFGRLKRRFGNAAAVPSDLEGVRKQTKCDRDASAAAAVALNRQPCSRLTALHTPSPSPETVLAEENRKKQELTILDTSFEAGESVTRSLSGADSCRGTTSLSTNSSSSGFAGAQSTTTKCSASGSTELNSLLQFVLVVTALNGLVAADDDDHNIDGKRTNKKAIPSRLRQMISHAFAMNYENIEFIDIGPETPQQPQTVEDMQQNSNAVSPTLAQLRRRNRPIHPAQQRNLQSSSDAESAAVVERKLVTALTAQRVSEHNDAPSSDSNLMTTTAVLLYFAQCAASFDAILRFFGRAGATRAFAQVRFVLIAVYNIDYNFGQHHLHSSAVHRPKLSQTPPPVTVSRKCGEKLAAAVGGHLFELNESELTPQRIKSLLSIQVGGSKTPSLNGRRPVAAPSGRRVVDDVTILPTALATASTTQHSSSSSGSSCSIM